MTAKPHRAEGGGTIGAVLLVAFGYLIGALPFAVALAVAHGIDPAAETDIYSAIGREVGWVQSVSAVVVDVAKGVFPVLLGFGFSLSGWAVSLAAAAAVVGQMWPPLRGHGGRGDVTGIGALVTLALVSDAYPALWSLALFAFAAAIRIYMMHPASIERLGPDHPMSLLVPVAVLSGFCAAPWLTWSSGQPAAVTAGLLLVLCAIAVRRLTAGVLADLSVGAPMGPVLLRRLLFDESLIGRD